MPIRVAMIYDGGKTVVPMSPAKNKSALATIPTKAAILLKMLLPSMTAENISPPISKPLRPAV